MSLDTSPDNPAPLHRISAAIGGWIARLGSVWVEGQITELVRRDGNNIVYLTVRDVQQNISMRVVASAQTVESITPPLEAGARIVLAAKPEFWSQRGQLMLRASEIRAVGLGDLLARIERLKATLAAEGLFARDRKRPLPFLPAKVGLICGRGSAAERDVVDNAARRWPAVEFVIKEVVVQGKSAAADVTSALRELDAQPEVEVIVIARGGGSAEDLLPFSDEDLIRAVANCRTPVVSAIGHEQDTPLLDYVADLRASTPTDAARRIVPDLGEQQRLLDQLRESAFRCLDAHLTSEQHRVSGWAKSSALADPTHILDRGRHDIESARHRAARSLAQKLQTATSSLHHLRSQLHSLSPAATLERGYAIALTAVGAIVRDPAVLSDGTSLHIKVQAGSFRARAEIANDDNEKEQHERELTSRISDL